MWRGYISSSSSKYLNEKNKTRKCNETHEPWLYVIRTRLTTKYGVVLKIYYESYARDRRFIAVLFPSYTRNSFDAEIVVRVDATRKPYGKEGKPHDE